MEAKERPEDVAYTVFHPWERPAPILSDAEFQCYNDPVWRVAKLSRMIRQLQTCIHTWKDFTTTGRNDFHRQSEVLQQLISELAKYAEETKTSLSNCENTWPHQILKSYSHTEIARAFHDDTTLADHGVEDTVTETDMNREM